MKAFPLTDLNRKMASVRHAAAREPVVITDRQQPRFVLMSYEDYEALARRGQDPRSAFRMDELSADEADRLVSLLEEPLPSEAP